MTAQAQKPDSVFQRNGRVHLYWRGCQFSRVLAFLECGSAENDRSNTGWTVPSQAEDCWLPTPFASFPFTSPPVRRRVPPDSVSTLIIFWGQTLAALWVGALSCNKKKSQQQNAAGRTRECTSGGHPLLLNKILHLLFFSLVQILCALCLESRKKLSTWS